jgi:hypothetical protein
MIVAQEYRKSQAEVMNMISNFQPIDFTPQTLLTIDYAFHSEDVDYDSGLSFLDRLHWKLSMYYPIQWNIQNLKNMIRNSNNPASTFVDVLNEILTDDMVTCYGV